MTDSIKIKTDASEEGSVEDLRADSKVCLIYNENDELIEVSTGRIGGRGFGRDFRNMNNMKIGKITSIVDNTITVALAKEPEKPQEQPKDNPPEERAGGEFEEKAKESEMELSGESVTITLTDSIKIKTDASEEGSVGDLTTDSKVCLIYNENDELIEVSTKTKCEKTNKPFNKRAEKIDENSTTAQ